MPERVLRRWHDRYPLNQLRLDEFVQLDFPEDDGKQVGVET